MAETSGPFDPVDPENPVAPGETLAEAEWELMLQTLVDGVPGVPGAASLGASLSGASVRGVDIAAGSALVRGHWYKSSAVITKASSANAAGAARIDRAVLRLNRTSNTVTNELVEGTAGSGQPPALVDNGTITEQTLWRWTIQPGATVASGLVDERQWLGRPPRPCTSTNRPLNPLNNDLATETDTGNVIRFNGAAWDVIHEDTGDVNFTLNGPDASAWTKSSDNYLRKINSVVHLRLTVRRWDTNGLGTADPDGSTPLILDTRFRPPVRMVGSGLHSRSPISLFVYPDGRVVIVPVSADIPAGRTVYATATWMVG